MAGGVRAATAYIDIKLGSFTEFKAAAERRAKETAERVAKQMTDDITKKVDGKKIGGKLGDEISQTVGKKTTELGNTINGSLGASFSRLGAGARSALQGVGDAFGSIRSSVSSLEAKLAKVGGVFDAIGRKIGFASFMAQGLAYDLTFGVTLPAVGAAAAFSYFGLKAGMDLEQARASLAPFVGGLQAAQKEIEILSKIAQESPAFDALQVVAYAKSLIAAGLSVEKTNALFKATSNIFTTLGLSVDQANGAFYAITQIMQKGTAQSEELSQQLAERGVPVWKLLADSLGVTQQKLKEMVKEGKVTATDFVDAMIKAGNSKTYLEGAGVGADTLKSKLSQLKETIQFQLASAFEKYLFPILNTFLDRYGPGLTNYLGDLAERVLPKVREKLGDLLIAIDDLKKKWDSLSAATKDQIKQFLLLLIAAGPALLTLTKIGSAIGAVSTVAALAATPLGLLGILLAGAGIAAYSVREEFKKWFKDTEDGRKTVEGLKKTFESLKTFFEENLKPALKNVRDAVGQMFLGFATGNTDLKGLAGDFAELRNHLEGVWKELKEQLKPAWDDVVKSFKDAGVDISDLKTWIKLLEIAIKGIIIAVGLLASIFGIVFGFIAGVVAEVLGVIENFFGGFIRTILGIAKVFSGLISGDWQKIKDGAREFWDGLWQMIVSTIVDGYNRAIAVIDGLVKGIVRLFKFLYDVLVGHSIVPDLVNAIIDWFKRLPGMVAGIISDLVSRGVSKFIEFKDKAVGAVSDLPSKVSNKVGEAKDAILSKVSGFGSLLVNSGKELIQGLIRGIDSMLGALGSKASEMANTVARKLPGSPVKEGPLRVLNNGYAGKQIVKMIADGMNPQPLEYAATNLAAAALPGINAVGPALSGTIQPGVSGGITINQTNNIPAPIVDPQDIATYSARRLVSALTTKATP